MSKSNNLDTTVKFRPDYKWPKVGTEKNAQNALSYFSFKRMFLSTTVSLGGAIIVSGNFQKKISRLKSNSHVCRYSQY